MASEKTGKRIRLGELLVAAGVLDETHLNAALAEQRKWGGKLGRVLIDMKLVSEDLMVKALSRQLGLARIDLDKQPVPPSVVSYLGVDICERYGVFPVGRDEDKRVIQVAAGDPTNYEALDEVAFRTGLRVEAVVATASAIDRAIRRYYYGERGDQTGSQTLDPKSYGLAAGEETLELDTGPLALSANPTPGPGPGNEGLSNPEMIHRFQKLEETLSAELKALRSLVELLVEQGVIKREDYLTKVRN